MYRDAHAGNMQISRPATFWTNLKSKNQADHETPFIPKRLAFTFPLNIRAKNAAVDSGCFVFFSGDGAREKFCD